MEQKLESIKRALTSISLGLLQLRAQLRNRTATDQTVHAFVDRQSSICAKALDLLKDK